MGRFTVIATWACAPALLSMVLGGSTPAYADHLPNAQFVIMGIGDSYAAGEGQPQIPGMHSPSGVPLGIPPRTETWSTSPGEGADALRCHRSPRSSFAQAVTQLSNLYPNVHIFFRNVACSGAGVYDGLLGPYPGREPGLKPATCRGLTPTPPCLRPQLEQLNALIPVNPTGTDPRKIDALLVNIGGNDAGFGLVVASCLIVPEGPATVPLPPFVPGGPKVTVTIPGCNGNAPLTKKVADSIGRLPTRYKTLIRAINGQAPDVADTSHPEMGADYRSWALGQQGGLNVPLPADRDYKVLAARARPDHVYITEYPDAVHAGPTTPGNVANPTNLCDGTQTTDGIYKRGSLPESKFILNSLLTPLNQLVQGAVTGANTVAGGAKWTLVSGIFNGFVNHGMCAPPGATFFNFNAASLVSQGADVDPLDIPVPDPRFPNGLPATFVGPFVGPIGGGIAHPNLAGYGAIAAKIVELVRPQIEAKFRITAAPLLSLGNVTQGAAAGVKGGGTIGLRWQNPQSSFDLLHYTLHVESAGRAPFDQTLDEDTTSVTLHGMNGRYVFRLRADGPVSSSPLSRPITVSTVPPNVPNQPQRLSAPVPHVAGTITVIWGADTVTSDLRFIVAYRRVTGGTTISTISRVPAFTEVTVGNSTLYTLGSLANRLANGDNYEFKVKACNTVGCSEYSPSVILSVVSPA